jgi:Zn-dependent alcohol dehydrogenase
VAGHESAGTVLEVGPGVRRYKPGDRVLVTLIRSCGRCFFCEAGHPQRCETLTPLDRSSRLRNAQGLLDELITERFPLGQINEAIAHTGAGAALRNIIVF